MKRKIISFFTLLFTISLTTCLMVGCKKDAVKLDGDYVVITATADADGKSLLLFMEQLKEKDELRFEMSDGMVVSIDGKQNASDFSSCWMLYTSDSENANNAWGIVEYDGKEYGSATFGAEQLIVKEGAIYIWWYQTF